MNLFAVGRLDCWLACSISASFKIVVISKYFDHLLCIVCHAHIKDPRGTSPDFDTLIYTNYDFKSEPPDLATSQQSFWTLERVVICVSRAHIIILHAIETKLHQSSIVNVKTAGRWTEPYFWKMGMTCMSSYNKGIAQKYKKQCFQYWRVHTWRVHK